MTILLSYSLLIFAAIILIVSFLLFPRGGEQVFVRISTAFMMLFLVVPAILALLLDGFNYADLSYKIDGLGMLNVAFSVNFFLAGFFFKNLMLSVGRPGANRSEFYLTNKKCYTLSSASKNRIIAVSVLVISFSLFELRNGFDQEILYLVRRGETEVSHLQILLESVISIALFSVFFISAALRWRTLALVSLSIILIDIANGSPGRFNFVLAILTFVVYLTRVRAQLIASLLPLLLVGGLPLIIGGKSLIYSILFERQLPSISMLLNFGQLSTESYFNNFAHPFVSLYQAFELIDEIGLRLFYDFIHGIAFYGRVIGLDLGDSLTYYNTEHLIGVRESIVPPGYLAFGFVQAGHFGVFLMGIFYRLTFRIISSTHIFRYARSEPMIFFASFLAANTFYIGEIRTLMMVFFLQVIVFHVIGKLCIRPKLSQEGR